MLEAYSVGIRLKIENLISPQLKIISDEFAKLDGLTISLQKSLKGIAVEAGGLKSLAAAGNASNKALEKASLSAAALEKRLVAIRSASAFAGGPGGFIPIPTPGGGGAPRLPGGGGRPGGGGGGTHGPGGGWHGGNIHMGPRGVGLGTVGMAAGDWFWPLAATGAAVYGGKALFESAKSLEIEQTRFRQFGMSEAQNQEAFKYAAGLNVFGTTQLERLSAFREAQGVFRESGRSGSDALEGAKLAAPVLAKLDFLAKSLDEEGQAKMHTANLAMLRYVESSGGLKNAAEFNRIADFGYKLNVSSGGTVNWEQLRQFKARAKVAGFNLTDDAMARLEPTMAEAKGGAAGYGLSTAYNRMSGMVKNIPTAAIKDYLDSGLWDRSKVVLNANGGVKMFHGNPLSQDKAEMFSTNPELFYETYVRPWYDKKKFSFTDRARENVMMFGGTGGYNATLWEKQQNIIQQSVSALAKTAGINPSYQAAQKTLSGQETEFIAAWEDFKTNFGKSMLPSFSGMLKAGSAALRQVAKYPETLGFFVHPLQTLSDLGGRGLNAFAPSDKATTVNTTINLDGKKIANIVSKHQANAMSRPQTGHGLLDDRLTLTPAGGL